MKAAYFFQNRLKRKNLIEKVHSVRTDLYGSLALTGHGHGTPGAILMGLEGHLPETVDPDAMPHRIIDIRTKNSLQLGGVKNTFFDKDNIKFLKNEVLPFHSNAIKFNAFDQSETLLDAYHYYSIGGGFVLDEDEVSGKHPVQIEGKPIILPEYPFHTASELIEQCQTHSLTIAQIQMRNELRYGRTEEEVVKGLNNIWAVMERSIDKGMRSTQVILPGGLNVKRRAPHIYKLLEKELAQFSTKGNYTVTELCKSADVLDWISLYAMAVNEENAGGGSVVTAPTNGAAGVIPAVLKYYLTWTKKPNQEQEKIVSDFLLTAGVIGMLFKKGASISAAEVGCQGEIGVASSMAAAALCAIYGGNPLQATVAAEIAMEHHLGMTCDPIGGLVQVPCIERNTMGAIKAVNSARLACLGSEETAVVSLDSVIETMLSTGRDMQNRYKETSLAGLAVSVKMTEC